MGGSPTRLGHVAALDGLRGTAFLTVLAYHLDSQALPAAGYMGVDLFFGLSGFLITVLIIERFAPAGSRGAGSRPGPGGRRALADFYARRVRRLVPALVVFLACYVGIGLVFGHDQWFAGVPGQTWTSPPVTAADLLHAAVGALGYFSNLAITFGWTWGQGAPIGHLWTLAVEGQFYVAWGLLLIGVLFAVRGRRRAGLLIGTVLALALGGFTVASTAVVWHLGAGAHYAYFATWTRGQTLVLGAAAGLWWSSGGAHRLVASAPGRAVAALLCFASGGWLVAAIFVAPATGPATVAVTDMAALSVACALVVVLVAVRPGSVVARAMAAPALRYVGRRSYALYLWHYPLLAWFRADGIPGDVAAVGLAFLAAELSWNLVERPVLTRGTLLPWRRSDPAAGTDRRVQPSAPLDRAVPRPSGAVLTGVAGAPGPGG